MTRSRGGGGGGRGVVEARSAMEDLEDGWPQVEVGISVAKRIVGGEAGESFTPENCMNIYNSVYNMCAQEDSEDLAEELYGRYKEALDDYIKSTVVPSLNDKHGELLLRELVQIWSNYKTLVRWLSWFLQYLDRFFVVQNWLEPLTTVGYMCFRNLVLNDMKSTVTVTFIGLAENWREGQFEDLTLLKNILDIYVEVGLHDLQGIYMVDFEDAFLKETADSYFKKFEGWILQYSYPEYMLRVKECLKLEERIADCWRSSMKLKLLQIVYGESLAAYTRKVLDENSGCKMLLSERQVQDLANMVSLFSKHEGVLLHASQIFTEYVKGEGVSLLKQALDAATIRKNENTDVVPVLEQDIVREILDLHTKYFGFVKDCFKNHDLFHKELEAAFVGFCNSDVAACVIAQLFMEFCNDNTLQQNGQRKPSDGALDTKKADMSKIFRLFCRFKGTFLMSEIFMKHVKEKHMPLLEKAVDAISNQKDNIMCALEQDLVRRIIELHDKYLDYVTTCFENDVLFHKALEEAFAAFRNCDVLFMEFFNNTLEQNGSGLNDEAECKKIEDLSKMFKLFSRFKVAVPLMTDMFCEYTIRKGMPFLKQAIDALAIITWNVKEDIEQIFWRNCVELLELFRKCAAYITSCFQGITGFRLGLKVLANQHYAGYTTSEAFALFCHLTLKKRRRGTLSDEVVEQNHEQIVKILPSLECDNLERFHTLYRSLLGKKLISKTLGNETRWDFERERSLISKLKSSGLMTFIPSLKIEGMFKDISMTEEHKTKFDEYIRVNPELNPGIDFSVTVLTSRIWPDYKISHINFPSEMLKCMEAFNKYYHSNWKSRRLTWFNMGVCTIIGHFNTSVELVVQVPQAALLLLFNHVDRLSYSEIVSQLNLTDEHANDLLRSVSHGKFKILKRKILKNKPLDGNFSPDDVFKFNSGFTDGRRRAVRIKIPEVTKKIALDAKVETEVDKVPILPNTIDACMLRIMRRHQTMSQDALVTECARQLKQIRPNSKFERDDIILVRRIWSLIDREYFERDKETPNSLRYLP